MSSLIASIVANDDIRHTSGLKQAVRGLVGPGLLVAVGYVDPGNWATDIAGGTGYGYALLTVVVLAGVLAMGVQALVARVTVATGEDLASLSRRVLPRSVAIASWLAAEAAILATALAELVGGAIALRLLFGLSLEIGLVATAAATIVAMTLWKNRADLQEKIIGILIAIVTLSFLALLIAARPDGGAIMSGIAVSGHVLTHDRGATLVALGIVGATIMPHNLYLHSGLLAQRLRGLPKIAASVALKTAVGDTVVSLTLATLVNAAILIVAASSIAGGAVAVASLDDAHAAMKVVLGGGAALLFAIALYAAGQSSAITGVVAGHMLTNGFRGRASTSSLRGIVTRVIAVAVGFTLMTGQGGRTPDEVLVLSQVVLSLALPFALLPLVVIAARKAVMGRFVLGRAALAMAVSAVAVIVALDLYLMADSVA
ncbi:MAG TPA: Nramp family divalent metal transporter [Magnetospirillaceae bacterium]|jgi:manganese transport protein